jgi:hypothetical protein
MPSSDERQLDVFTWSSAVAACWISCPATAARKGKQAKPRIFMAKAEGLLYLEAFPDSSESSWVAGHKRAFERFGGVPMAVEPLGLTKAMPGYFSPGPVSLYADLAEHFGFSVRMPRVLSGMEKSEVKELETSLGALLADREFDSLKELNRELETMCRVNGGSLRPLPGREFKVVRATRKVGDSLHVQYRKHWYSVPFASMGETVSVRVEGSFLRIQRLDGVLVCEHKIARARRYATESGHMPRHGVDGFDMTKSGKKYDRARLIEWAKKSGESAARAIMTILDSCDHEEQGYRSCLALLGMAKGQELILNEACKLALDKDRIGYGAIKAIFEKLAR